MSNRIHCLEVIDQEITPAQAIIHVRVTPERIAPGTEVRGRFIGPHCRYAGTVEVAYPLRPIPGSDAVEQLTARVVIPEPSLWEPESPFLYQGIVELWQDGQRSDQLGVSHGLRQVQLSERGLHVNGRVLVVHGTQVESCTEDAAQAMRDDGINLWLVPVEESTEGLWDLADQCGFLILGRIPSSAECDLVERLDRHASCLGWIVPEATPFLSCRGLQGFWSPAPDSSLPDSVRFVVRPASDGTNSDARQVPTFIVGPDKVEMV
jgi:hypothetical protein